MLNSTFCDAGLRLKIGSLSLAVTLPLVKTETLSIWSALFALGINKQQHLQSDRQHCKGRKQQQAMMQNTTIDIMVIVNKLIVVGFSAM